MTLTSQHLMATSIPSMAGGSMSLLRWKISSSSREELHHLTTLMQPCFLPLLLELLKPLLRYDKISYIALSPGSFPACNVERLGMGLGYKVRDTNYYSIGTLSFTGRTLSPHFSKRGKRAGNRGQSTYCDGRIILCGTCKFYN